MLLSPGVSHMLAGLLKQVTRVREERKVWSLTLGALASHFEATAGAAFLYRRSHGDLCKVTSFGPGEPWHEDTLLAFFHNRKPDLDANTIMAPVRVGTRVVGVLALGGAKAFRRGAGREATEILKYVGQWTGCRKELAVGRAECAVGKAVLGHVKPKDVIYRVLHQLRRLIAYDHGATVVGALDGGGGRVIARQVAWTRGRSDLVGGTVSIRWEDVPPGPDASILTQSTSSLWDTLGRLREAASPPKESIIIGQLNDNGRRLGLVEISSSTSDFFLDDDTATLSRFLPYLAWCVRCIGDTPGSAGAVD